jgi:hypothetical protein
VVLNGRIYCTTKSCFSGESKDIERLELKAIAYTKKICHWRLENEDKPLQFMGFSMAN